MRKILASLILALAFLVPTSASALAPIPDLSDANRVVDTASILDATSVQAAVDYVNTNSTYRLYVVATDSFDGLEGGDWATQTALASGLDPATSIVFAVATEGKYGSAFPNGSKVGNDIGQIEAEALEYLRNRDFNGAVTAYSTSVIDVANSVASDPDTTVNNIHIPWRGILNVIIALILIAFVVTVIGMSAPHVKKMYVSRKNLQVTRKENAAWIKTLPTTLAAFDALIERFSQEVDFVTAEFNYHENAVNALSALTQSAKTTFTKAFAAYNDYIQKSVREQENSIDELKKIMKNVAQDTAKIDERLVGFNEYRARAQRAATEVSRLHVEIKNADAQILSAMERTSKVKDLYPQAKWEPVESHYASAHVFLSQAENSLRDAEKFVAAQANGKALKPLERVIDRIGMAGLSVNNAEEITAKIDRAYRKIPQVLEQGKKVLQSAKEFSDVKMIFKDAQMLREALDIVPTRRDIDDPVEILAMLESGISAMSNKIKIVRAEKQKIADARSTVANLLVSIQHTIDTGKNHYSSNMSHLKKDFSSAEKSARSSIAQAEKIKDKDPIKAAEILTTAARRLATEKQNMEKAVKYHKTAKSSSGSTARSVRYDGTNDYAVYVAVAAASSYSSSSSSSSSSYGSSGGSYDSSSSYSGGSFGGGDFGSSGGSF